MTRIRVSLAAVIAAVLALGIAVSGGMANTTRAASAGASLSAKQTSLGKVLVAPNGRTLYLFEGDRQNMSTLSRAGLAAWPPFTWSGKPHAGHGIAAAHIATIASRSGKRQVTYYGHPLYYFVGDHKAGQMNGQGLNEFGGYWYTLSAQGNAVTRTPSTPAPAPAPYGPSY